MAFHATIKNKAFSSEIPNTCFYEKINYRYSLLSKDCPIGVGVWGEGRKKEGLFTYWIQCGVTRNIPNLESYRNIDINLFLKKTSYGYHCLVGPFYTYESVKEKLTSIQKMNGMNSAFIREVELYEENKINTNKRFKFQGKMVISPFIEDTPYLYRDNGDIWTRVDYSEAFLICKKLKMKIPDSQTYSDMLESNIFRANSLPESLPYWSDGHSIFTLKESKNLLFTLNSMLNFLCIESD